MQVLLHDEFYDVMGSDHVALVPLGVAEVTETGLIDAAGHRHDVDAIIWATGRSPLETNPWRRSRANQQKTHASVCAGFNLEGMYDRVGIYGQGGKHWGELLRREAPVRRWSNEIPDGSIFPKYLNQLQIPLCHEFHSKPLFLTRTRSHGGATQPPILGRTSTYE